jgi:L-fucose isomerase-like protein
MCGTGHDHCMEMSRRGFLYATGLATAGVTILSKGAMAAVGAAPASAPAKGKALVRVAFLYPPTESLKKAGYYSWPGSGFDAEGHHRQYASRLEALAGKLGIQSALEPTALQAGESVTRFIEAVKQQKPDGLMLIAFKKSEWDSVKRIIKETGIPTIAVATLGVLLMGHIKELNEEPGVHLISSLDDFEALEYGLRMIRTIRWMKDACILSVAGGEAKELTVDKLGARIKVVPMQRFTDVYSAVALDAEVRRIAEAYLVGAKERREPSPADVIEAARALVACRRILAEEQADVIMMDCLQGIQKKQIPPPCMAFMSLRDEGIVAGCQNDLDATLTMMLVQQLFGKPGFQHNPACDTEKNLYFGAHCTCPSRLRGPGGPAQPYILRNHAEAGVGAVPQVLWPQGQEVTVTYYQSGKEPQMFVYSGKVVTCYDTPPAGGCRTNTVLTINEVDASEIQGGHPTMFLGNCAKRLRSFCQLIGIPATL